MISVGNVSVFHLQKIQEWDGTSKFPRPYNIIILLQRNGNGNKIEKEKRRETEIQKTTMGTETETKRRMEIGIEMTMFEKWNQNHMGNKEKY